MSRVPALLVMHADLGAALLHAARQVYGPCEDLPVLSNEGLSRAALEHAIAGQVAPWSAGGLVLTDFWGGSCHLCGLAAARAHGGAAAAGEIVVVTGLNLPMLLDYLHNRDRCAVVELAERLQLKGQESVRLQRCQPA